MGLLDPMYNRAKYHPHQTQEMTDAMKIFKKWLLNYKKKKEEDTNYKFLPLSTVLKYEKIAEEYGVSKVARGLMPSTKTDEGFLEVYKKVQSPHKLQYIPVKKNKPDGQDYYSFRNSFIKSRLAVPLPPDPSPVDLYTIISFLLSLSRSSTNIYLGAIYLEPKLPRSFNVSTTKPPLLLFKIYPKKSSF